jgi:hypothetical protein
MTSESEEAFMSDHEVVYRVVCPDGTIRAEFFHGAGEARAVALHLDRVHGNAEICRGDHKAQSGIISWDEE